MRVPIQYALTYPERAPAIGWEMDWKRLKRLDFGKVSYRRFPCLRLAREALRRGGIMPCALNAADEVAVAAFLAHKLRFVEIAAVVERVLERMPRVKLASLENVLEGDREARRLAAEETERARIQRAAAAV
jgi:1-deoxy-D-xylulose-5-phosphate reductoisomerase